MLAFPNPFVDLSFAEPKFGADFSTMALCETVSVFVAEFKNFLLRFGLA